MAKQNAQEQPKEILPGDRRDALHTELSTKDLPQQRKEEILNELRTDLEASLPDGHRVHWFKYGNRWRLRVDYPEPKADPNKPF